MRSCRLWRVNTGLHTNEGGRFESFQKIFYRGIRWRPSTGGRKHQQLDPQSAFTYSTDFRTSEPALNATNKHKHHYGEKMRTCRFKEGLRPLRALTWADDDVKSWHSKRTQRAENTAMFPSWPSQTRSL